VNVVEGGAERLTVDSRLLTACDIVHVEFRTCIEHIATLPADASVINMRNKFDEVRGRVVYEI